MLLLSILCACKTSLLLNDMESVVACRSIFDTFISQNSFLCLGVYHYKANSTHDHLRGLPHAHSSLQSTLFPDLRCLVQLPRCIRSLVFI